MNFETFFNFIFNIIDKLNGLFSTLYNFMIEPITIGRFVLFKGTWLEITLFNGVTFTPINILFIAGGGVLLVLLVLRLVKLFTPLA